MCKACVVFLIMVLIIGCEKQVTYHQNIWSGSVSKYCNLKKCHNRNQESVGVMNDNSNQERQNQYDKNSLSSNKESMQDNVKNNVDVSEIKSTNTHKKNNGAPKSKTDTLNSVDLEANILKLNKVLNKNSKQSELARQEGQVIVFSEKNDKINNKDLTKKKQDTKNDTNITNKKNANYKNSVKIGDTNVKIVYSKKNKKSLNDTEEFNSIKNEFSFGGL